MRSDSHGSPFVSRRSQGAETSSAAKINLTPLIDVVFILLIFFVVTSSFVKESGVDVSRPQADSATPQTSASIFVSVTAAGEVWIDRKVVAIRALRPLIAQLHEQNPQGSLVIVADRAAPTGLVVQVLDQARLAGISNVALAAKPTDG